MNKQRILEEIKRTAKANGGKPLGAGRFLQETGIKDSDWKGRYWARWGDAVKEAGLTPNVLQVPYAEDHLAQKLIGLSRELGRFPGRYEIVLKRRSDPTFPAHSVFYNRFGRKSDLVAGVLAYCRTHAGFEDVIPFCEAAQQEPDATDSPEEAGDEQEEEGFVYLLKSGRYYKIGKTNAVGRREYEVALRLPEKLQKLHEIRTDDPTGIEAYWHNRFATKRKGGEWFDLDAADVRAFKRRKFM
jgi:hypothetical protein